MLLKLTVNIESAAIKHMNILQQQIVISIDGIKLTN